MLELEIWQWLTLSGILLVACLVQSAVGFAAGMIFISLALHAGLPLPECIVISMVASTIQSLGGLWDLRADSGGNHLWLPIVCRLVWLPVGVFLLWHMDQHWDPAVVKQIVGGVVILAILSMVATHLPQIEQMPTWITVSTFSISGLMHGAIGMAGPPVILWLSMLNWSSQRSRVFLFQLFLASIPFQSVILWVTYPQRFLAALVTGFALAPAMLLGSVIGLWIGNRLDRKQLRVCSLALLALIAIGAILGPFFAQPIRKTKVGQPMNETRFRSVHGGESVSKRPVNYPVSRKYQNLSN